MKREYLLSVMLSLIIVFPLAFVGIYVTVLSINLLSQNPIIMDVYLSSGLFWAAVKGAALMATIMAIVNLCNEIGRSRHL